MNSEIRHPSILVTGADGFIGAHLVRALRSRFPDFVVFSSCRKGPRNHVDAHHLQADMAEGASIDRLVDQSRPDVVIHLAAQASVGKSLEVGSDVWEVNVGGTRRLAAAVRAVKPDACFIFASSAEVYGDSFQSQLPMDEDSCPRPMTPYARSKLAAEFVLRDTLGVDAQLIILRFFNHVGPGQGEQFVAASFAAQLARIERQGGVGRIEVGDLTAKRDFGDVRDAVAAILAVIEARATLPAVNTFNVCSGEVRTVRDLLDKLIAGSTARPEVVVSHDRLRSVETPCAAGSIKSLCKATGWSPGGLTDETIKGILDYWRQQTS
ncbi:NAD-dependent epimerase/dehydratase family protein [Brevundimonas sp. NIBR10]|uniref:NAD-dependent epimerase/dehydratase family protein n=1 Tax=Brevundimonas sp. NIBR10 TaxID=3015997 RepID=UPI0022F19711|nr:NAD-dependent epimerase/dehydratase family protein [Brevundimonas sp. NIBR10]